MGHKYVCYHGRSHSYIGHNYLGPHYEGHDCIHHFYRGLNICFFAATGRLARSTTATCCHNYIGHIDMGHNCMSHNCMGHNYMDHNYTGHCYMGRNCIGYNYVCVPWFSVITSHTTNAISTCSKIVQVIATWGGNYIVP